MPSRWTTPLGLSLILLIGLTATPPAPASAQEEPVGSAGSVPPGASLALSGDYSVTGTVVSSNDTRLVIADASGRSRDFALDPAASYAAAMFPGDEVRVRYDPVSGKMDLAKDVQTLYVTQKLNDEERARESYAMSKPPTGSPLLAQADLNGPSTAAGEATGASPSGTTAETAAAEEFPATATPLPLMAVTGILILSMGAGLGLVIRRSARRT